MGTMEWPHPHSSSLLSGSHLGGVTWAVDLPLCCCLKSLRVQALARRIPSSAPGTAIRAAVWTLPFSPSLASLFFWEPALLN